MLEGMATDPGVTHVLAFCDRIYADQEGWQLGLNDVTERQVILSYISKVKYRYPQTLYYLSHGATFPLFIRAAQRRHFARSRTP